MKKPVKPAKKIVKRGAKKMSDKEKEPEKKPEPPKKSAPKAPACPTCGKPSDAHHVDCAEKPH